MKKILHIIRPANMTGAVRAMLNVIDVMDGYPDCKVEVASGANGKLPQHLERREIPCYVLTELVREPAPINDLRALYQLYSLLEEGSYDVVHTHASKSGVLGRLAAWFADIPVTVHTVQGIPWKGNIFFESIARATEPFADLFIALTESEKKTLVGLGAAQENKVHVIPNSLDIEAVSSVEAAPVRQNLGISEDTPLIGFVARLKYQKHPQLFAEMAARIARQVECEFIIAGDGELRGECEDIVRAHDLADRTHFLGWRDDARAVIRALDVYVLPSRWEGLSVALIEASLLRTPIVATNVQGNADFINDGRTGRLVPEDPDALADTVIDLIEIPEKRQELAESAFECAVERYDRKRIAEITYNLYESATVES